MEGGREQSRGEEGEACGPGPVGQGQWVGRLSRVVPLCLLPPSCRCASSRPRAALCWCLLPPLRGASQPTLHCLLTPLCRCHTTCPCAVPPMPRAAAATAMLRCTFLSPCLCCAACHCSRPGRSAQRCPRLLLCHLRWVPPGCTVGPCTHALPARAAAGAAQPVDFSALVPRLRHLRRLLPGCASWPPPVLPALATA